ELGVEVAARRSGALSAFIYLFEVGAERVFVVGQRGAQVGDAFSSEGDLEGKPAHVRVVHQLLASLLLARGQRLVVRGLQVAVGTLDDLCEAPVFVLIVVGHLGQLAFLRQQVALTFLALVLVRAPFTIRGRREQRLATLAYQNHAVSVGHFATVGLLGGRAAQLLQ